MSHTATENHPVGAGQSKTTTRERITNCRSVYKYLTEHGSATSVEIGEALNLLQPPGAIRDLRKWGHIISKQMVWDVDRDGVSHRCARYEYHGWIPPSRKH